MRQSLDYSTCRYKCGLGILLVVSLERLVMCGKPVHLFKGGMLCESTSKQSPLNLDFSYPSGRPDPPRIVLARQGQRQVELKWQRPDFYNSTITSYEIEQRSRDNMTWVLVLPDASSVESLSYTVRGLVPYEEYEFRIRAENSVGYSNFSETSGFVRTLPLGMFPPFLRMHGVLVEWCRLVYSFLAHKNSLHSAQ